MRTALRARFALALAHVIVLALVLFVGPRTAHAEPTTDDAAIATASKARFTEGMRLFTKKRYDDARVAFLQANALKKRPSVTLMLARCALETGRPVEALEHLDAFLAVVPEPTGKARDHVESVRREARARLGHLRITIPEGAVVTIDGEPRPATTGGATLDVMPGRHEAVATFGDETKTEHVDVTAGATVDVKPTFKPKPLRPVAAPRLEKPKPSPPVVAGASASAPGLFTPPATTWPIYGAGAIGLGGLTAAVILGGLTSNADHAVDVADGALARSGASRARCSQPTAGTPFDSACSTIRRNESASRALGGASTASLAIGLSGIGVATFWYVFAPKDDGAHQKDAPGGSGGARVSPWVSASSGGAALEGSF